MTITDGRAKELLNVSARRTRALQSTSRLWRTTVLAATATLGCGASHGPSHADAAGAGGSTIDTLSSLGLGGTGPSQTVTASVGGTAWATTAARTSRIQVEDPESDEPCDSEPDDGTWSEVELSPGIQWQLAFAQRRAILTSVDDDKLFARVSEDSGQSWSDAKRIDSDESAVVSLGMRVIIAPDGSSAFAYWQSTGASRWVSRYDSSNGWSAPTQVAVAITGGSIEPFADNQLVVLSNGKAVLAHEFEGKTTGIEYRLFDGASWGEVKSLPNGQFAGVFLGQGEIPTLYTEEADPPRISPARRTLDFATGWSEPEFIPYQQSSGAYQLVAFEGLHGKAARIRRDLGSDGVQMRLREGGTWSPDEALGESSRNLLDLPSVAEAGDELLAAWSRPSAGNTDDASELFSATRKASAWQTVTIPRSRNLTNVALVGGQTGVALLTGSIDRFPESSLTKVFRRGTNGRWYCPHLKKGSGLAVAAINAEGIVLVAVSGDYRSATVMRFEPG